MYWYYRIRFLVTLNCYSLKVLFKYINLDQLDVWLVKKLKEKLHSEEGN